MGHFCVHRFFELISLLVVSQYQLALADPSPNRQHHHQQPSYGSIQQPQMPQGMGNSYGNNYQNPTPIQPIASSQGHGRKHHQPKHPHQTQNNNGNYQGQMMPQPQQMMQSGMGQMGQMGQHASQGLHGLSSMANLNQMNSFTQNQYSPFGSAGQYGLPSYQNPMSNMNQMFRGPNPAQYEFPHQNNEFHYQYIPKFESGSKWETFSAKLYPKFEMSPPEPIVGDSEESTEFEELGPKPYPVPIFKLDSDKELTPKRFEELNDEGSSCEECDEPSIANKFKVKGKKKDKKDIFKCFSKFVFLKKITPNKALDYEDPALTDTKISPLSNITQNDPANWYSSIIEFNKKNPKLSKLLFSKKLTPNEDLGHEEPYLTDINIEPIPSIKNQPIDWYRKTNNYHGPQSVISQEITPKFSNPLVALIWKDLKSVGVAWAKGKKSGFVTLSKYQITPKGEGETPIFNTDSKVQFKNSLLQ